MTPPVIHHVTTLDLAFEPWSWPFAEERRAEIEAHFAVKKREKPIWNGRFLAWRDWGCPDRTVFNGFGMGALRCADGVFVLGEMGQHTANAGRVYFPSGTPDLDDISGRAVDIAGSVAREV